MLGEISSDEHRVEFFFGIGMHNVHVQRGRPVEDVVREMNEGGDCFFLAAEKGIGGSEGQDIYVNARTVLKVADSERGALLSIPCGEHIELVAGIEEAKKMVMDNLG
jgi:hypothetical protein